MQSNQKKLTIIGSGPTGLFCAFFALKSGYKVEIITKPFGQNHNCAGLAAGGMLAPSYEFFQEIDEEFIDYAFVSRDLWDEVAIEFGFAINPNTIALAKDGEKDARFKEIANFLARRGICEKTQNVEVGGNSYIAQTLQNDGLINPRLVHELLLKYLNKNGVNFSFDEVVSIEDGELKTKSNNVGFDKLIIAAGIGSRGFSATISELLPLVPVRGQTIEIKANSPYSGAVRMGSIYALQRDENTIIGATSVRGDNDWAIRISDNRRLLDAPHGLPNGFRGENIIAAYAGVRPATEDNYPIVGPTASKNVFVATGAYRNGWLLAPNIGKGMIELIENEKNGFPTAFNPQRFQK